MYCTNRMIVNAIMQALMQSYSLWLPDLQCICYPRTKTLNSLLLPVSIVAHFHMVPEAYMLQEFLDSYRHSQQGNSYESHAKQSPSYFRQEEKKICLKSVRSPKCSPMTTNHGKQIRDSINVLILPFPCRK